MGSATPSSGSGHWYIGSAVPDRNVAPPTSGCTALGKIWAPLSPDPAMPFFSRVSWDWCQDLCNRSTVTLPTGMAVACAHFAFFPDGKCFLQGPDATLQEADRCNTTVSCEHDFQVVSGPADCALTSMWAVPPPTSRVVTTTTPPAATAKPEPTIILEGGACLDGTPPFCKAGLVCAGAAGQEGICKSFRPAIAARMPVAEPAPAAPVAELAPAAEPAPAAAPTTPPQEAATTEPPASPQNGFLLSSSGSGAQPAPQDGSSVGMRWAVGLGCLAVVLAGGAVGYFRGVRAEESGPESDEEDAEEEEDEGLSKPFKAG